MSIVYEGSGTGGNLFEGRVFWFSQRVPQRLRWEEAVKANGGQVAILEKNADILIADHARANAPPGSYSWTFIEASVKNGKLEDPEDHRAGQPKGTVRPVGSGKPTKTSRTPFTTDDDRMLAEWVTKAERKGLSTKGNKIYEDLERVNPRHTYQSWRDRWVKYVSLRPRPELSPDAAYEGSTGEDMATRRTDISQNRSPRAQMSNGSTRSRNHSPEGLPSGRGSSSPSSRPSKPMPGNLFTEKDAKLLEDIYNDIVDIDETRVISAWIAWADENPQHTADEWHSYWLKEIKPRRESVLDSKPSPTNPTGSSARSTSLGKNPGTSAPVQNNLLPSQPSISQPLDTQKDPAHLSQTHDSQSVFDNDALFVQGLDIFAEGQNIEIDYEPTVCGRRIHLFDLWNCVNKDENGGFDQVNIEGRWQQIAVQLSFRGFGFSAASQQLRQIYEQSLADFEEFWKSFRAQTEKDSAEQTDSEMIALQLQARPVQSSPEQVTEEAERQEGYNDDLETSASPSHKPRYHKRQRSVEDSDSIPHKRYRSDEDEELEIPPTPDIDIARSPRVTDPETQDFHFSQQQVAGSRRLLNLSPSISPQISGNMEVKLGASDTFLGRNYVQEDSSTQSQTDSLRDEADLQAFIDRYVSLGYTEQVVIEALQATTMETGDAAEVMESLMRGDGVPPNIQGVWTTEEDQAVISLGNSAYYNIELKHGKERCERRRHFLRDRAAALKDMTNAPS